MLGKIKRTMICFLLAATPISCEDLHWKDGRAYPVHILRRICPIRDSTRHEDGHIFTFGATSEDCGVFSKLCDYDGYTL